MSLTNFGEALGLDYLLDNSTRKYVGLLTVAPGEAGGGTEVTGGGYGRATATWAAAVQGAPSSKANSVAVTFATATANWAADPTRITDWAIFDAVSGGNMIWYGKIKDVTGTTDTPREVLNGDTVSFPIGALVCRLD